MKTYKLIIFDIDGTLVERDTDVFLPGAEDWLREHGHERKLALATNQGGVGLRYWMESGGFGEPEKYPTKDQALQRIISLEHKISELSNVSLFSYVCFAYQSEKSGKWSPTPPDATGNAWRQDWRKPAPGMLLKAIEDAYTSSPFTLFVGDFMSDKQAAENAGCDFQWAWDFFERPKPEGKS